MKSFTAVIFLMPLVINDVVTHPQTQLVLCYVLHNNTSGLMSQTSPKIDCVVFHFLLFNVPRPLWSKDICCFEFMLLLLLLYIKWLLVVVHSQYAFFIFILSHSFIAFSFWKKVFSLVLMSLFLIPGKPFLIEVILFFTLFSKVTAWNTVCFISGYFALFYNIKIFSCPSFLMCHCLYISFLIIYRMSLLHVDDHYGS